VVGGLALSGAVLLGAAHMASEIAAILGAT
jgi:hypothetical protein